MAEKTNISWTDSTINFWSGCTKVSPGCANCYAEALSGRNLGNIGKWGKGAPRQLHESAFKLAEKVNRKPWICDECGHATHVFMSNCPSCDGNLTGFHRRRIFSLSLGDWLDEEVPIEWLARMLDTIRQCSDVTWILCTKRPEKFVSRFDECGSTYRLHPKYQDLVGWLCEWKYGNAPKNIILLTSVENQEQADKRIPELLKIPAACHGLSLEPLLGPVSLSQWIKWDHSKDEYGIKDSVCETELGWLIIGGESGRNARPCNVGWIHNLVSDGRAAGIPTFVKQLGAFCVTDESTPDGWPVGTELQSGCPTFSRVDLKHKKGGDHSEWPADLRIQQFIKP